MRSTAPMIGICAAAALAVVGLGVGTVVLTRPDVARHVGGSLLNIAVVPPVERPVAEGEVMDVGQLTDGYVHREPEPAPPAEVIDAYLPDEDYTYSPPAPVYRPWGDAPPALPAPAVVQMSETPQGNPMAFGFDAPRPDYAAEREARRARLDAMSAVPPPGEAATAPDTFY